MNNSKNKYRAMIILFLISILKLSIGQPMETSSEPKEKPDFLVGKVNRSDIQKGEFAGYFFSEYKKYNPEQEIISKLKNGIYNKSVLVVLGTWCHDSKEQVPKFFKILDQLDYNTSLVEIICVDRKKTAGSIDISQLKIERVPTFIFYEKDIEVGRIIETPVLSIEEDLLNILNDK